MSYHLKKAKKEVKRSYLRLSKSYDVYKEMLKHLVFLEKTEEAMLIEIRTYKQACERKLKYHFEFLEFFYHSQDKLRAIRTM